MAIILRIENTSQGTTLDLNSDTAIKALIHEPLERDLSYVTPDGKTTRIFRFKVTGSTKALARTNANSLISIIRQGIYWRDDDMEEEAAFLAEGADGETLTRMLITEFTCRAVTERSFNPLQGTHTEIIVALALTLQNHREAASTVNLGAVTGIANGAIGNCHYYTVSTDPTRESRLSIVGLGGDTADVMNRVWIGMMPSRGGNFIPVWPADDGTASTDTSIGGADATSFSGTPMVCTFATDESMTTRVAMEVTDIYSGSNEDEARGVYVGLVRYKTSASGTIAMRVGVKESYYDSFAGTAYNETRFLNTDTDWHFVNIGVLKLPPHGYRHELTDALSGVLDQLSVVVDAQRLTGSATLTIDSITMIPANNYIEAEGVLDVSNEMGIFTDENFRTYVVNYLSTSAKTYGSVVHKNNWRCPIPSRGVDDEIMVVYAAEGDDQVFDHDLSITSSIYSAYEAYNE